MAGTTYGVNHPLAVKAWERKLAVEALKQTWIYKFIGKDSNALIEHKTQLEKGDGDRIRIGLRMQLSGDGVSGDGTLEGNEENLTTYYDDVVINQLRHAVRVGGEMSQQRVPFSIREEARLGLQDWWADRIDTWFFNQIAGYTTQSDVRYTGMNAVTAPDSSHVVPPLGNAATYQASEASLTTSITDHIIGIADIDRVVAKAKTLSPAVRPIMVGGERKWCMFMHPFQIFQMRSNTNTGQWLDIQKAAMQGGQVSKNPIYTGAVGEYNSVVIHESTRVPNTVDLVAANNSNSRRAIFCGAQAASIAFGQKNAPNKFNWVEETFDYKNQLGVAAGTIGGLKKMIYNSADFATIVVPSYAPDPTA